VPLSDVIGGGDPERVASEIILVLAKHVDLTAQRSVLDVGCGCGRIATALTQYLDDTSDYVGVDIIPGLVQSAGNSSHPDIRTSNFSCSMKGILLTTRGVQRERG